MKITAITPQKKRTGRYSVYIDETFAFGVSQDDVLALGIYSGQELSEAELETLKQQLSGAKAYAQALRYLGLRPRSEQEIITYLQRKQYSDIQIKNVMKKLRELELVDDARFARSWVQWRQSTTPRSRHKLVAELRQKGIDAQDIEAALADIDRDEQITTIRNLIQKRGARYDSREKLLAYLARQGFAYDDILSALQDPDQ